MTDAATLGKIVDCMASHKAKDLTDKPELTDDDECGCLSFRIQKKCFTYRISAPYSEERKATARAKMQELNAKK